MYKPFKIKIIGLAERPEVWTNRQADGNFLLSDDPSKAEVYTDSAKAFEDRKLIIAKLGTNNVHVTFDWSA